MTFHAVASNGGLDLHSVDSSVGSSRRSLFLSYLKSFSNVKLYAADEHNGT